MPVIAYFPNLYEDELVYSLLSRFYLHTGYLSYFYAAENLYVNSKTRPDHEFINEFLPATIKVITQNISLKDLIEKHTMYPYYGRFLSKTRRQKAFAGLLLMHGNYRDLLAVPNKKSGAIRTLRYCPECAKADRKLHGETYWHRNHQLIGVSVCPTHKCQLMDTSVIINGNAAPNLVAAEKIVPESHVPLIADNTLELQLAAYVIQVFQSPVNLDSDVPVGQFLHSKLFGSNYVSVRGEQRNISLLHRDLMDYYRILPTQETMAFWQLQKVFTGYRHNTFDVCQLAMFLRVPIMDLVKTKLPKQAQPHKFDTEIKKLRNQGMKYPQIAEQLNASYSVVKAIGEDLYGSYKKVAKSSKKCGAKPQDWDALDTKLLPEVQWAVKKIYGSDGSRPHKVTVFAVCRLIGLSGKKFHVLPKCKAEILKYREIQEHYWAREVIWAANQLLQNNLPVNWTRIRNLTNMKPANLKACLPYIHELAHENLAQLIISLL